MSLIALAQLFDFMSFEHASIFHDASYPWEVLKQLNKFLNGLPLGELKGKIDPRAILERPELISIGRGTTIEGGAFIRGPCVIGEGCQVRQGAYIRGEVLVGDNCVIGHSTEVKHSIFLNGAQAGHFAYVGDSILGNGVNLGAGTKCANLRFDRQVISVRYHDEKINTGLKKLGAIFGDGSQTGCNSVTNPGTVLDKEGVVLPCTNVSGYIKNESHSQ